MTGPSLPIALCSPHLSWAELACRDRLKTPYPLDWRETRARELAAAFEELRAAVGLPLVVLSAYRTIAHNRAIGGSPHSQHVEGRALDLAPPDGWTPLQLAAVARDIPEIVGVGFYPARGFVHIDVRTSGRRVAWQDVGDGRLTVMA
jgi:uncharacterized protein YcbK (DUF882 family)